MYAKAYEQYKQQGVLTAGPGELLVMLYDEAIKQLKMAGMSIEKKKHEQTNLHLQKVQSILMELINSLDFHYEIANELFKLYEFLLDRVIEINIQKDSGNLPRLIGILSNLREAWIQAARASKAGGRSLQ